MIRAYFNEKAAIWDEAVAEKDTAKLSALADRMNIKPGSIVFDVGAGTGVFAPYILSKIGGNGRLVAADLAEEMLKRARAKGFNGNIEYLHADVTHVPLPDEVFDVAVCYSSFPHFQDKPRALSELNRVLKKGGRLFICHTSGRTTINEIHRQIPAVENDAVPDRDEMYMMLSVVGFVDIGIDDEPDSYFASARKPKVN
jgi:ubiquinone/menaquinone biosynthesis C-methylase UbiE